MPDQLTTRFGRAFSHLNRLFPGGQYQPGEVSNVVQPVFDLMGTSVIHQGVRFLQDVQTDANAGGGDVNLTHVEPAAGFCWLPLMWSISYDGAVTIAVDCSVDTTSSAPDPWGRWNSAVILTRVFAAASIAIQAPAIPILRGNRFLVTFRNTVIGQAITSRIHAIECPVELIRLEHWRGLFGNMVNTRALP